MYLNADNTRDKNMTVGQYIYYMTDDKKIGKLELPDLGNAPDAIQKEIIPKFIEKAFGYKNAFMGCFVTEAYVTAVKNNITDEDHKILSDESVSADKKREILESYHKDSERKERTIMNFMLSQQAKDVELSERFITFEKKKHSDGYLLIPDDRHDLDSDSKDASGRFHGLM
jgi:hypothetical protein